MLERHRSRCCKVSLTLGRLFVDTTNWTEGRLTDNLTSILLTIVYIFNSFCGIERLGVLAHSRLRVAGFSSDTKRRLSPWSDDKNGVVAQLGRGTDMKPSRHVCSVAIISNGECSCSRIRDWLFGRIIRLIGCDGWSKVGGVRSLDYQSGALYIYSRLFFYELQIVAISFPLNDPYERLCALESVGSMLTGAVLSYF